MKKKNAMISDVRARKDNFFMDQVNDRRGVDFRRRKIWKFIYQLVWLVD